MTRARVHRFWPVACVFVPAIALGLWVSLHRAFATWCVESDAATPYVLWHGLLRDGIGFLATFHYAPDNWLLWPLPAFFLAFATFGDEPWVVFAAGWAIFVACTVVAFLIVRRAAGITSAAATATVLLLSSRPAIGEMGFLTYPVSHNASLFLGLVALLAAIRWIEASGWPWLALATMSLAVAGLSDPWTEAAITVPVGFAAAALSLDARHAGCRRAAVLLAVAVGAAMAIVHTRLFGLLGFLPTAPIAFASGADRVLGAEWLARLGAAWFNALPGRNASINWIPAAAIIWLTEHGRFHTMVSVGRQP